MAIYIRRNDASYGPYPIEQVRDLIAQGMLRLDDLAQIEGDTHWRSLHEIPEVHVQPPPVAHPAFDAPDDAPEAISDGPQVRPWVRYWARTFDALVFTIGVSTIFAAILPEEINASVADRLIGIVALALWIPIEAAFLSALGATPGKLLLRIKVVNPDGHNLSYWQALGRSFNVWARGMGLGIPMISLVSSIMAYQTLTNSGKTSWDRIGNYRVRHRPVGALRAALIIISLAALFGLVLVGLMMERERI